MQVNRVSLHDPSHKTYDVVEETACKQTDVEF